ncbi:MAG: hypothetical protein GY730_04945 [bacterium]|nr:hypothetical protein [bacterium]
MITKKQILNKVMNSKNLSPTTNGKRMNRHKRREIFDAIFDTIGDFLETGESVRITGFGLFEVFEEKGYLKENTLVGHRLGVQFTLSGKRLRQMKL